MMEEFLFSNIILGALISVLNLNIQICELK